MYAIRELYSPRDALLNDMSGVGPDYKVSFIAFSICDEIAQAPTLKGAPEGT
jgi:hypothetical protein